MEKEFVTYQQALRLKELGFDEPCVGRYYTKDATVPIFMQWTKKEGTKFNSILLPCGVNNEKVSPFISAPTLSQAFRWFRKEYGYWSYLKEATKGTCRFYIEKFDEKFFNSDIIDTYEEAELACLEKLLGIVESKSE